MNIKVLGNGFISDHLSYDKITDRIDFSDTQIKSIIDKHKPDILINCVAKTGTPNTDWCETNKEITCKTNTLFPVLLANECERHSIHMIHIGTGSIFNGPSPNIFTDKYYNYSENLGWKEIDYANPLSYYEKTKYAADLLLSDMKNVSILRIKLPISHIKHNKNLITKLISYKKIMNVKNSYTFMKDFVDCLDWYTKQNNCGIYNIVNNPEISPVKIMEEYKKYIPLHKYIICPEDELDELTLIKRSNSILNIDKLQNAGFIMRNSFSALKETMKKYIGD